MFDFELFYFRLSPNRFSSSFGLLKTRIFWVHFILLDSVMIWDEEGPDWYLTVLKIGKRSLIEISWMEWVKHLDIFFFRFKHKDSL